MGIMRFPNGLADSAPAAILFDFGGTLDADGVPWSVRFHAAYAAAGGRLPYPQFAPAFSESDRRLAAAPGIRTLGFRATIDAQAALLADLLASSFDPAVVSATVHEAAVATVQRNRVLLAQLAAERPLGVISNFTGNLVPCLEELDLLAPFTVVCDSGAMGIAKPDPGIFVAALAALGARPARTWMVGDNPSADLLPAAALGMCTCWLTPPDVRRALPDGIPTARITTLLALSEALGVPCTP
jgi:FMN phosphatase YigB (HAD superfamily)